jgi:hypothetical protein
MQGVEREIGRVSSWVWVRMLEQIRYGDVRVLIDLRVALAILTGQGMDADLAFRSANHPQSTSHCNLRVLIFIESE